MPRSADEAYWRRNTVRRPDEGRRHSATRSKMRSEALSSGRIDVGEGFAPERDGQPRYRLRLARYPDAAREIDAFMGERAGVALDAGTGRGRLARYSRAPGLRWVGLDRSVDRLAICRRTGLYRLVRGDLRRFPFADSSFDVVACIQVIEHFEPAEGRALAARLGALLRPGGLLLLSVPIFPASVLLAKRMADRMLRALGRGPISGGEHLAHYTLRSAIGLLPAGFELHSARGQRLGSLPGFLFERYHWYYRLHSWFGERCPRWCVEVNLAAVKSLP